jgi:hypothetical protein
VLEESQVDLDVPRLVPDLAGHVHREVPRRVWEIADGAPGALHRLHLADHDAVDPLLDRLAARQIRKRRQPLLDLQLGNVARSHPDEAVLARELVIGDRTIHRGPPDD